MKNKFLQVAVASSFLMATSAFADIYIGADYGQVGNTDKYTWDGTSSTAMQQNNKYNETTAKIGFGTDGNWKMQFKYSQIAYELPIVHHTLSGSYVKTDTKLSEFGLDFIREFEVAKNTYPFLKFGVGYGKIDVAGMQDSTLGEVSMNAGLGISYKVINHVYIDAGVDYVYRRWNDIKTSAGYTLQTTGSGAKVYGGVNFGF